ncbi:MULTISPECIES: hypothetical protein [Actinoalloteichus]|uniref:ABC-2 family transporter protein n=1 Tax=Actinoalloteichus fjordicus TaxID=1612552 RepID=A0AAC9LFV3_9PSEU|nr:MULTISPECIES: hypothetical protein [Actinoalloteichus]APU17163.1 ABC-2 family transporter protein [Actinoalloteichus fjordicus]APU23246.1 ABC-2 family transporter protein [Actinoalloteichus sp. GBA129-24]
MLWLVWRRNRVSLISLFVLGGLLSAVFFGAGLLLRAADTAFTQCLDGGYEAQYCFSDQGWQLGVLGGLALNLDRSLLLLPPVVALLAGAPLLTREINNGHHRFLWSQERKREHWFVSTVTVMFGAVALISLLIASALGFWSAQYNSSVQWQNFDNGLLVLPATALFLTALGMLVGAATKRRAIGMVACLAVGYGLVLAAPIAFRTYATPETMPMADYANYEATPNGYSSTGVDPSLLYLGGHFEDDAGNRVPDQEGWQRFREHNIDNPDDEPWSLPDGLHEIASYHPAERYWPFQAIEAGILLGLTALCIGGTLWFVRRRAG